MCDSDRAVAEMWRQRYTGLRAAVASTHLRVEFMLVDPADLRGHAVRRVEEIRDRLIDANTNN